MRKITHIEALVKLAESLWSVGNSDNTAPVQALSRYLSLQIDSSEFARILSWVIAFYSDGLAVISNSSISGRNKTTASDNIRALFAPLLPPFPNATVRNWHSAALSQTNESYFDLLSDTIRHESGIIVPDPAEIESLKGKLQGLLEDMVEIGLPRWINDDYKASLDLAILALDKLPFLAHRIVQDSHNSILAKLFTIVSPEHKRFMVRAATVINIVLAAFVMPHEAADAATTYYGWAIEAPVDTKQIEACAAPLALPAPSADFENPRPSA